MKRYSWLLIAVALAWGCDDGETTDPRPMTMTDGGTTNPPGDDDGGTTDPPGDDDGGTTDPPGDDDGGTTDPPTGAWTLHSHPCFGNRTDTLWRDDDGTLYVGCGSTTEGTGMYVSQDGGATWDKPSTNPIGFFDTWRVLDISRSADGLLYIAGTAPMSRRVVSADTSTTPWTLKLVLEAGDAVGTSFTVGTFRRASDGRAVAESLDGIDVLVRDSDDDEWRTAGDWGSSFGGLQILDLQLYDDEFYGCGSNINNPPYLYLPLSDPSSGFGFRVVQLATDLNEYKGEMWSLAVDDGGIVVGGVNQTGAAGMIYALDDKTSTTMRTFNVRSLYPDDASWIRGVCRNGETIYAVGELTAKSEGIVLRSDDNGQSWTNVTPQPENPSQKFPPVHRCVVTDDHAYVTGANGMFAVAN